MNVVFVPEQVCHSPYGATSEVHSGQVSNKRVLKIQK